MRPFMMSKDRHKQSMRMIIRSSALLGAWGDGGWAAKGTRELSGVMSTCISLGMYTGVCIQSSNFIKLNTAYLCILLYVNRISVTDAHVCINTQARHARWCFLLPPPTTHSQPLVGEGDSA